MTFVQPRIRDWQQATNHSLQVLHPSSEHVDTTNRMLPKWYKCCSVRIWSLWIKKLSSFIAVEIDCHPVSPRLRGEVRIDDDTSGRSLVLSNQSFAQTPTYVDFNWCANIYSISSVSIPIHLRQDGRNELVYSILEQGLCADDDMLHRKWCEKKHHHHSFWAVCETLNIALIRFCCLSS